MRRKDHYHTLGVSRRASTEEIRAAYRALAKKHHPDVSKGSGGSGGESDEAFTRVALAYEVLSDTAKRREYDAELERAERFAESQRSGPRYSWENIAGNRGAGAKGKKDAAGATTREPRERGARPGKGERHLAEFDDLYDTFFGAMPKSN